MVFTLRQEGNSLTGTVEGRRPLLLRRQRRAGFDRGGKVDGDRVSFKLGNSTYSGTVKGDRIELERAMEPRSWNTATEPKDGLAIGPPPDGTNPSRDPTSHTPRSIPIVLHRVQR